MKKYRQMEVMVLIVVGVLIFAGCAVDTEMVKSEPREKVEYEKTELELDPPGSDWAGSDTVLYEHNNTLFFRGEVIGVYDLALGKRQAEADAKKRIIEKVRSEAIVEFRELTRGANTAPHDVGRFAEDMIESVAKVSISGITPVKVHWEEVPAASSSPGVSRAYHIFSLVAILKKEFDQAKAELIGSALQKNIDPNQETKTLFEKWKEQSRMEK